MVPTFVLTENSLFRAIGDIFHPLFELVAYSLAGIYSIVPTYGVTIIILTVVIMGLLTPLTIKSTRSMLAMQSLQPEMQKLRAKYKGAENRQQLNEEMMKLYRERGVSPTGGCLPMFLQMPALIVLYDTIRGLANTVKRGQLLGTNKLKCTHTICPVPRYVPHHSAIYTALVKTPGVMHSLGLNLAAKPLTHRANWFDYIPYFALLAVAVALQYFQMAQMTRRNKRMNTQPQMPQQMQTMQRIMPLFFAYIYFLVPTGVVIYMIISSGIRVLTQDLMFRYGIVQLPGGPRQVGGSGKSGGGAVDARATPSPKPSPAGSGPADGERRLLPFGSRRGAAEESPPVDRGPTNGRGGVSNGQRGASNGRRGASNGRRGASNGNTSGTTPPDPKAHPRSKAKRARKAR